MKKKTAITLIELIVSITTASILFILLGNIISKKLNAVSLVYEKGTYYCWKDWNGTLYQKTPMGSIQAVSSCRVKIPKNAKNVQSFVIGGGSSGYIFDKDTMTVDSFLENYEEDQSNISCIEDKDYDGYTMVNKNNTGIYKDITTPDKLKVIAPQPLHKLLSKEYTEKLIAQEKCAVPVYKNRSRTTYKLPKEAKYYFKGSSDTKENCLDAANANEIGTCYKFGFIKDNRGYDMTCTGADENKFTIEGIKSSINLKIKKSSPGDVVLGNAQPGKEYNFTSDNIGSGGVDGGNGKDTKFGDIVAKGGVLKDNNMVIDLTTNPDPVSDIKNQSPKEFNICSSQSAPCNGSFNEAMIGQNFEVKSDKVLSVDFNPKNDKEESVKTGFGLFGTSGVSKDCSIKYYQIKSFKKYNDNNDNVFTDGITGPIASLGSCKDNMTNGMGGAIIIKWN